MNRLKEKYQKEVVPALSKEFGYKNLMAVPKIEKVVVNMGLGEATSSRRDINVKADRAAVRARRIALEMVDEESGRFALQTILATSR